jgi:hypothetical protein
MKTTQKILTLLFLTVFFFSSCEKNEDSSVGSKLKHISYVKSIQQQKTGLIFVQYEYDKQGRISKVSQPMYENATSMYENGTIVGLYSYSDYVYNNEGELEKIIYYHSNTNVGFMNLRTSTYSYDKDRNKRQEIIVYPHALPFRTDSTLYYYDNNRLVREDRYEDGYFGSLPLPWRFELIRYIEYEYDDQGKLVKESSYSGRDNTFIQKSVHSYQNGLNVKTEMFNRNDEKIREIRRHYDKNNNLIYLESDELSMLSSSMSYVCKYEYY